MLVAGLCATAAGLIVVAVSTGTAAISWGEVVSTLLGEGDERSRLVLFELRLPRLALALVVGGALAAAGALFQSMTRNPLGSPDLVGFTTGAATGALAALLLLPTAVPAGAGAVVGGLAVAAVALALGGTGHRLVLVGIGLAALLTSVNAYLLTRADVTEAQSAAVWLVGSLNGRTAYLPMTAIAVAVLLVPAALLSRSLAVMELGDDKADSLGIAPARMRVVVVVVAIGLTAAAVAAAGPIAFVALAAPQLARRAARAARPLVLTSALLGAVLLLASDLLAQRVLAPQQLPVGAATGVLGGVYLAVVLALNARRERR
ncbi:iron chelate uptake ABC transporter family permease subunit [Herbiconiux moechotypicola]|uniref:Iron chelate uptake ABC transporter family permease subunit n=1 Tax=Herbiconiux moechotypicola TaxID=637393 RepID=A0ABN3D838_9MICO|nr:iron chelate uptake ABC transporter family permease subunit [Herbiconiux moechotypicola]MCS5728376.1 iron chelate uptake ABC transporter family permease subunit [Herbiconiux moechotypicola]